MAATSLMVVAGFLGAVGAARAGGGDVKDWTVATEPFHIAGPIYYVGTKGICAYLIATPGGNILLSGGMPGTAPLLEASIRRLGFKVEDIRVLLISHAHFDHVGSLAEMKTGNRRAGGGDGSGCGAAEVWRDDGLFVREEG